MGSASMVPLVRAVLLAAFAGGVASAFAAEKPPDANGHRQAPKPAKKMRMDEPMATGMMKEGMKKGDVSSAADKKAQEMQPMMEREEKSMPQKPGKSAR